MQYMYNTVPYSAAHAVEDSGEANWASCVAPIKVFALPGSDMIKEKGVSCQKHIGRQKYNIY